MFLGFVIGVREFHNIPLWSFLSEYISILNSFDFKLMGTTFYWCMLSEITGCLGLFLRFLKIYCKSVRLLNMQVFRSNLVSAYSFCNHAVIF